MKLFMYSLFYFWHTESSRHQHCHCFIWSFSLLPGDHFIAEPFGGLNTMPSESKSDRNNRATSSSALITGLISQPHSLITS